MQGIYYKLFLIFAMILIFCLGILYERTVLSLLCKKKGKKKKGGKTKGY